MTKERFRKNNESAKLSGGKVFTGRVKGYKGGRILGWFLYECTRAHVCARNFPSPFTILCLCSINIRYISNIIDAFRRVGCRFFPSLSLHALHGRACRQTSVSYIYGMFSQKNGLESMCSGMVSGLKRTKMGWLAPNLGCRASHDDYSDSRKRYQKADTYSIVCQQYKVYTCGL